MEKKVDEKKDSKIKEKWKVIPTDKDLSKMPLRLKNEMLLHIENLKKKGGGETMHATAGKISVMEVKNAN